MILLFALTSQYRCGQGCPQLPYPWQVLPFFFSVGSSRASPLVSILITSAGILSWVNSSNILCHWKGSRTWPLRTRRHFIVHPNMSGQAVRWKTLLWVPSSYHQLCYYDHILNSETPEECRLSRASQSINTRKINPFLGVKDTRSFPLEAKRGGMKAAGSLVMVVSLRSSQHGTAACCAVHRMVLVETICPLLF